FERKYCIGSILENAGRTALPPIKSSWLEIPNTAFALLAAGP
ncbi:MAG: hypothetical protein ACI95C_002560, partial [Pseudohongiellaceae bacterium]